MLNKLNIFVSYSSQLYVAILSIAIIPIYAKYLGVEAYGLIGFSLMLQAVALIFDMGLAQTFMRETARTQATKSLQKSALELLHSSEWFFLLFSFVFISTFTLFNEWLSINWLQANELSHSIIQKSLFLIAITACFRWFINFYRSGLFGYGDHIWVNLINIGISSVKYLGVLPCIVIFNFGIIEFFFYQMLVGLLEAILYRFRLYSLANMNFTLTPPRLSLLWNYRHILGPIIFASWVWITMTQLDKLLLSHWLDLENYGYYSLAIAVAGVILLLSAPLNQLLQPQLTILAEAGKRKEMIDLYRLASQILTASFMTMASLVAFFAEPILFFWSGNQNVASLSADTLFWYVLGNAVAALLTLPYMLQFAIGNLRLHTIGNAIFALCWLPAIAWAAYTYGGTGAGIIWLSGNILFLIIWTNIVYKHLFPELYLKWIFKDVIIIAIPILSGAYFLSLSVSIQNFFFLLFVLVISSIILAGTGLFFGKYSRNFFIQLIKS